MSGEKRFNDGGPPPPLVGRTVAVTRAPSQSTEMTTDLERLGAKVIHCPTIEIAAPESWVFLDAAIKRLADYDWVVFTSANAVEFFHQRSRTPEGKGAFVERKLNVCAIGPATARALETEGVLPDIIAPDSRSEGVLAALIDHLGSAELIRGLSFLIPRARVARDVLPDGLRELGARVDAIEAYQTIKPRVDRESLICLFKETTIDAITFTSSSTVSNFAELVGLDDLSELLANTIAFCIGPVTAQTAERYRIPRIVHPQDYNSRAMVEAIVRHIGSS